MKGFRADGRQSEASFQDTIIDLMRKLGYEVYHTHDSRHSPKGFPDIIGIKPLYDTHGKEVGGKGVVFECKVPKGKEKPEDMLTPEQRMWLGLFHLMGFLSYCVGPEDWEEIEEVL